MCFFKAPKITTQAINPNVMQALPASATAPTPESPVFGADDSESETAKGTTGTSSLKIRKTTHITNTTGSNLQLSGLKV